ncbi:hypothetical protein [Nocardioides alcanivorans]|uniref:hypothetical protein n=1 Tax=Nocardioides alcanivorans TaxID=2897352 RepID=UPI001F476338|nr:hypothetical protein [Nocardioides alcanivorans]
MEEADPLAVLAVLAAGCGDDAGNNDDPGDSPARTGDGGDYFFEVVAQVQADNAETPGMPPQPESLEVMLPCGAEMHSLAATDVVVGEVTGATEGDAYVWGDEAETPELLKDFTDPKADARDILITISGNVLTSDGARERTETVTVRTSVPDTADPEEFLESAGNLGDVVALLSPRPNDPHEGDLFPALNGASMGLVDQDEVSFPALADGFAGDYTTTDAILSACPAD